MQQSTQYLLKKPSNTYGYKDKHNDAYSWEVGISFLGSSLCSESSPKSNLSINFWGEGGEEGEEEKERERLRSASHKYVTNAILFKGQLCLTNLSVSLNS